MDGVTGDFGALGKAVVFLAYFKNLPDPRQRAKVVYPLDEVLLFESAGGAGRRGDVG